MWYVWLLGICIYISIYKIPHMPIISLDQQPTKHWVTKESRNDGPVLNFQFHLLLISSIIFYNVIM
jgi:hypothetical protein